MTVNLALFFAGLLAGEELAVRYGVRAPVAALADAAHIQLRQGLIRTLRILVPIVFLPALGLTVVAAVIDGDIFRWAAVAAIAVFALATFGGTVPINAAALDWRPEAPPNDWKAQIERWERLNTVRCWTALLTFALLLTGAAG